MSNCDGKLPNTHPQPERLPTPTHLLNGKIQRGIASTSLTNFFNFGFYVCASGVTLPYGKKAYSRFITFGFIVFDDNTVFLVLDSDVTYWW